MKKITLLVLFLSTLWGYAQVKDYTFSQTMGTYTEITGGTYLGNESSDAQKFVDPAVPLGGSINTGVGLPIGFNFTFNGFVYDRFAVCNDGWISFGSSTSTPDAVNMYVSSQYTPLNSVSTLTPAIQSAKFAALAKDLAAQAGSTLSYETIGTAPNRVLVVQWKNYTKKASTGDDFNFQIRLHETSNLVQVVYGSFEHDVVAGATYQVGLRAEPVAVASNFSNRKSTTGWSTTVAGTLVSDNVAMTDVMVPAEGLTFTWTPPACGAAKDLVATSISTSGATLNWSSYSPVDLYGYVVTKSTTLPLPTDLGTETVNPTATISNLDPNTIYNVFVRTKCPSGYTAWISIGTFKTLCLDALTYYDDFDSYPVNQNNVPDCWSSIATGTVSITSAASVPMTPPNRLSMSANGSGTTPTYAYAIMPPVSNLAAGTHRLRFTAYSSTTLAATDKPLEVGYFTTPGDLTSFVVLESLNLPGTLASAATNFTVTPGALPAGVKNLVFKNVGKSTGFVSLYIDNVVYEPIPACADVTAVTTKKFTHNSVELSWTKGANETEWQYVMLPFPATNPNSIAAITHLDPLTSLTVTSGLEPSTKYTPWVRSKCGTSDFGAWVSGPQFTTPCAPIAQFMENYDSELALPACWQKVGTTGTVTVGKPVSAPSGLNALYLSSSSATTIATAALPPLSNSGDGTHRLRFKATTGIVNSKLDIGYMDDLANPSSFVYLQTVEITNLNPGFGEYIVGLGQAPKSPYLAFRNSGTAEPKYSYIYIDDLSWEAIPTCADIQNLNSTSVSSSSASISWTAGASENDWQYAKGSATDKDPFSITPVDISDDPEATISGLDSATTYKIWVRSKCSGTSFGAWIGPVEFVTPCPSITTFTQNFDAANVLPECWTKQNSKGTATINSTTAPSLPYALYMTAGPSTGPSVIALPPVSNATLGTHRLRFKTRPGSVQSSIEVGYLQNYGDTKTFIPLYTHIPSSTTEWFAHTADLGLDPATDYIAIRVPVTGTASTSYFVDDVIWEKTPTCLDVKDVSSSDVTSSTAKLTWTKGGSETKWDYVYTSTSITDPNALTPVEVLTTPEVTLNNLAPITAYKYWIRSKCVGDDLGIWVGPYTFTTLCGAETKITQNFDASGTIPSCWYKLGSGSAYIASLTDAPSKNNVLYLTSFGSTAPATMHMPPISNLTSPTHGLKFKYRANTAGSVLEVGYITTPGDPTSFTPFSTFQVNSTTEFLPAFIKITGTPLSDLIAFRNTGVVSSTIYIDDVSWDVLPTTVPACTTSVTATPDTSCGNFATTLAWTAVDGVDGYRIYVGSTPGGSDVLNGKETTLLTTKVLANADDTFYYTVKPFNNVGNAANCPELTYSTNVNKCFCTSTPTSKDGTGVTKVVLGATEFAGSNITYYDFTSKPVNLQQGVNSNLNFTYNFGTWTYNTYVWIDFNDNYTFEQSEQVFTGATLKVPGSTLDASFLMPATAPLGMHRMRIGTSYNANAVQNDPCYSGGLAVTLDFNVNVVVPVANDTPANAVALTVGANFAANSIDGTNVNSTGSLAEPAPGCGNYNGMDVWYKASVPTSGNLTFEVNSVSGGLTNTAAAAYSGTPGNLTLVDCNDTGSTAGDDHAKIVLNGKNANDVYYFRVWENGGDLTGAFKVSAYESALAVDAFDIFNFSYYPNPVKDMLTLSLDQEISNVSVVNLLGQEVIAKSVNANHTKVDMSQLSTGTYMVKVTAANQVKTIKVVKK